MSLSCEVWSADDPAGTKIGDLTEDFGRTFQEVYGDVGAGTVILPRASADISLLSKNRWLKFRYNGLVAFSMRYGPWRQHTIAEGEEAEQVRTISGPGGLAALKDAITHHHTGTGRLGNETDTRYFNFAALDYTDWTFTPWIAAKALYRQDDALSPYGFDVPEGWPDGTAYWMWGTVVGGGSPPMAVGDSSRTRDSAAAMCDPLMSGGGESTGATGLLRPVSSCAWRARCPPLRSGGYAACDSLRSTFNTQPLARM